MVFPDNYISTIQLLRKYIEYSQLMNNHVAIKTECLQMQQH